jgi:hypothetical protein
VASDCRTAEEVAEAMRTALLACLAIAIQHGSARCEVPITAPAKVDPYTLADVQFTSDAKFVKVKVSQSLYERVRVVRVMDGGGDTSHHYVFTARPGKYLVEVDTYDPEKGIDDGFAVIEVAGSTPEPLPDPDDPPGPGPQPAPSPNLWGVGELCQRNVPKLSAGARAKAGQLAELYAVSADRLNGDSQPIYPTILAAWTDQQQRQTTLLGADKAEWMRVVLDPVGEVWNQHRAQLDRIQIIEFWRSVAAGIRPTSAKRATLRREDVRETWPLWTLSVRP